MGLYALTTGLAVGLMLWALGVGGFWFMSATVTASELIILIGGIPLMFGVNKVLEQRGLALSRKG